MAKKKRKKKKMRAEIGMRPYADRLKIILKDQDALPRFRQDLSIIEDLARMAWHVPVLERSLKELVDGTPEGRARRLEERLVALATDVERVHGLCRSVRGPLRRLLPHIERIAGAAVIAAAVYIIWYDIALVLPSL